MSVIASAYVSSYPSNPVISGASAVNEVLTASSATAAAWQLGLLLQAATPVAGYSLVNGTGQVTNMTWTAPNDGNQHRIVIFASIDVTSGPETGGAITGSWTVPDGTSGAAFSIYAAGLSAGLHTAGAFLAIVEAGATVTVNQSTALTGGASKLWCELWGS